MPHRVEQPWHMHPDGRTDVGAREVAERLSHALRTPLTTLYTGSTFLNRRGASVPESTLREVSAAMEVDAERLRAIVENLVIAALPEAPPIAGEPVLLGHLLPAVVEHEQHHWPGSRFVLCLPPRLPAVQADEIHLAQVLRNLLSNAARFGPADGVVAVTVTEAPGRVVVRISDHGPGVERGETERVFGLFYRSPATAERAGLGLGLFVCRRLLGAMGGRIWVRRRARGGAEFCFELPIHPSDDR